MALTGLQIFKKLPGGKKEKEANCKKCGFPTCMAFAMKLAKGQADIEKCEYISDELKSLLTEASQKQQEEITFGAGDNQVKIGNETVMFRHEKTLVNPTCIAVKLLSNDTEFDEKLNSIINYSTQRVSEDFKVSSIMLEDTQDGTFVDKVNILSKHNIALILKSSSIDDIKKALETTKDSKPLVMFEGDVNLTAETSNTYNVPIVVSNKTLDGLANTSETLLQSKVSNIVLNLKQTAKKGLIENLTHIRRAAIEDKFRPFGFPVMIELESSGDQIEDSIWAASLLTKYSNIIVLDNFEPALISALLTLRQNIYTDPQKPLQVEPKLYSVGEVDENSPIFVTTNFALTYFAVISELEASGKPAYLLITPSDGMSVLTAWSASKFTGEIIAKAFKECNVDNIISHRTLIICGYVSSMKEEIEDEMPDWTVQIGPSEAIDLVDYLKNYNL